MSGTLFRPDVDEEGFGNPVDDGSGSNSRLGSLFVEEASDAQRVASSLTYSAPKQPNDGRSKSTTPEAQPKAPRTVFAQAVFAFAQRSGEESASRGKLGLALVALPADAAPAFKLLLYDAAKQPLCHVAVDARLSLTVAGDYAQFLDERAACWWSVAFEQRPLLAAFCKWIVWMLTGQRTGDEQPNPRLVLVAGDGQAIQNGDSIEVDYVTSAVDVDSGKLEEAERAVAVRLKLGKGKLTEAWEKQMLGMRRNEHCIFSANCIGPEERVSEVANKVVIVELLLKRVKFSDSRTTEAASADEATLESSAEHGSVAATPSATDESAEAAAEQPAAEAPSSPQAAILSRVAKIGQQMFPVATPTAPTPTALPDSAAVSVADDDPPPQHPPPPVGQATTVEVVPQHPPAPALATPAPPPPAPLSVALPPPLANAPQPVFGWPYASAATGAIPYQFLPIALLDRPSAMPTGAPAAVDERLLEAVSSVVAQSAAESRRHADERLIQVTSRLDALSSRVDQLADSVSSSSVDSEILGRLASNVNQLIDQLGKDNGGDFKQSVEDMLHKQSVRLREQLDEATTIRQQRDADLLSKIEKIASSVVKPDQAVIKLDGSQAQVKKIMSKLYKAAAAQFDDGNTYEGSSIKGTLVSLIKEITMKELEGATTATVNNSGEAGTAQHHESSLTDSPPNTEELPEIERLITDCINVVVSSEAL